MALFRTCSRLARFSQHNAAIGAVMARRQYADAPTDMAFTFATPSECFYANAKVTQVDVPSLSGDFGILAQHVPTLAALKPGVVAVHEEDATVNKYFVSSGTVTVNNDSSVQILAEEATPLDRLDMAAVREGLSKAQQEMSAAGSEKAKAEAQIAVECYEAMQTALS